MLRESSVATVQSSAASMVHLLLQSTPELLRKFVKTVVASQGHRGQDLKLE
jgi:hypothetical protein